MGDFLEKGVTLGQQRLGNHIVISRKDCHYLNNGIRNAKFGYRGSKTKTNAEKVRGGWGRKKIGMEKGRDVVSRKEGQEMGKAIR